MLINPNRHWTRYSSVLGCGSLLGDSDKSRRVETRFINCLAQLKLYENKATSDGKQKAELENSAPTRLIWWDRQSSSSGRKLRPLTKRCHAQLGLTRYYFEASNRALLAPNNSYHQSTLIIITQQREIVSFNCFTRMSSHRTGCKMGHLTVANRFILWSCFS